MKASSYFRPFLLFALTLLVVSTACDKRNPEIKRAEPDKGKVKSTLTIYTTFYPMTYFAQRIAGDKAEVICPCPADADPAHWMPSEDEIEAYQKADLIVINGADFEKWIGKVTLPETKIVNTTQAFSDEFITLPGSVVHSHGPGGAHTHAGIDGHTWLDPAFAKRQSQAIRDALISKLPEAKADFEKRYEELAADLDLLDKRLKEISPKMADVFFIASHPAFNYVGRSYGWQQKFFLLDPEEKPSPGQIGKIKDVLAEHPTKYLLWESQPTDEVAAAYKESLGLEVIIYSPCESMTNEDVAAGYDFIKVMNRNVDTLAALFAN